MTFTRVMQWVVALVTASAAGQAGTLAYEGFDYLQGGCLAGGATGEGWVGAWGDAGEGGNFASELIIGPGSFPVVAGGLSATGNHVDLNSVTGDRRITRRMSTVLGGGNAQVGYAFSYVLDCGNGLGVDFAGVELSHSAGGTVVFLGKPPGAGPGNAGAIGMDVHGQGFVSSQVPCTGQKLLRLQWSPNPNGPETLTLLVRDAVTGQFLGSVSQTAEVAFDQVTLVARRDLAAGGSIPAFDELRASTGEVLNHTLTVSSASPAAGVVIAVTPADGNGAANGVTGFERSYPDGTIVSLTAPAMAGEGLFQKWRLNGEDYSSRRNISLTLLDDSSLAAVYRFTVPEAPVVSEQIDGLSVGADSVSLSWTGIGGRTYVVEASSDLKVFHAISEPIDAEGGGSVDLHLVESLENRPAWRFYRLRITIP